MEELMALVAKTYGIAGLLIAAPFISTVFLWRANVSLQAEVVRQAGLVTAQASLVAAAEKARAEDQVKRVADTERMMEKVVTLAREQTVLGTEQTQVLERLAASVDKLERHALQDRKGRG